MEEDLDLSLEAGVPSESDAENFSSQSDDDESSFMNLEAAFSEEQAEDLDNRLFTLPGDLVEDTQERVFSTIPSSSSTSLSSSSSSTSLSSSSGSSSTPSSSTLPISPHFSSVNRLSVPSTVQKILIGDTSEIEGIAWKDEFRKIRDNLIKTAEKKNYPPLVADGKVNYTHLIKILFGKLAELLPKKNY